MPVPSFRAWLSVVCASLGLWLLGLSAYGLVRGLRNPAIVNESLFRNDDIVLEPREFWRVSKKRPGEDERDYILRVNSAVSDAIAHYWSDEGVDRYNLRVPARENYWLYLAGWIFPSRFGKHEFHDPEKAVERGVGLCSQQAIILERVLERNGITAKVVGLRGHVVTLAGVRRGTDWWILDPDYGVAIETRLEKVERDPSSVIAAYALAGVPPDRISGLVEAYRAPNDVFETACAILGRKCTFESISYVAKWVFPAALLALAWMAGPLRRRLRSSTSIRPDPASTDGLAETVSARPSDSVTRTDIGTGQRRR